MTTQKFYKSYQASLNTIWLDGYERALQLQTNKIKNLG